MCDDMEAAAPGEETAAASALLSMNTNLAAVPRPAAAALEAGVPLPAQVPVSCLDVSCQQKGAHVSTPLP